MKIIFLFSLAFLPILALGQFAIILDKDGHCKVRSSAEFGNNVSDTLNNGHFIFCFLTKGNWTNIDYSKKNRELNGYVYHDRAKLIADYDDIPFISEEANTSTFGKDSIKIILAEQKFDKGKYRFSYYKDAKDQIELINGKQYWGTDGEQPKTEYKSISITISKRNVHLPKTALENLFEPSLHNTQVNYDRANDILYIQSMNSDGAGLYFVIWKIEKGVYQGRYIAYEF